MPEARTDWSATINLPKTDFPMKGDLAGREPELLRIWEDAGIYQKLQERQLGYLTKDTCCRNCTGKLNGQGEIEGIYP